LLAEYPYLYSSGEKAVYYYNMTQEEAEESLLKYQNRVFNTRNNECDFEKILNLFPQDQVYDTSRRTFTDYLVNYCKDLIKFIR
jgi:hypothetical protein